MPWHYIIIISYFLDDQYHTMYKEPWSKKGRTVVRIPSYCDRIVYHSLAEHAHQFKPEMQPKDVEVSDIKMLNM